VKAGQTVGGNDRWWQAAYVIQNILTVIRYSQYMFYRSINQSRLFTLLVLGRFYLFTLPAYSDSNLAIAI